MSHMLAWIMAHASANQVFSGVMGAGLVGSVIYSLKSIPGRIFARIKWLTTVEVTVTNEFPVHDKMVLWLADRMDRWYVRSLKLSGVDENRAVAPTTIKEQSARKRRATEYKLGPGYGSHWLIWNRWPYYISRSAQNAEHAAADRVRETLSITTLGFHRERMLSFLAEIYDSFAEEQGVEIYMLDDDWWQMVERRSARPMDSIILPEETITSLCCDIERFLESEPLYVQRGIPYRRGYLFEGAPGTGKSSLALALAGHFEMPIYVMNLASISSDSALMCAMKNVPSRSIVVIEDIDATVAVLLRSGESKKEEGVTLSGVLNCLDGIVAKEGRVLIMTSNHPERLDPALIRRGRVDYCVKFHLATAEEAARMFLRFFEEEHDTAEWIEENYKTPISHAEIQGHCQNHEGDPMAAAQAICATESAQLKAA